MRTYISPIGYDTRRVTQPVIDTGVSGDDTILLVRPGDESDTERATQTITDVEQLLQKIEPGCAISVNRVSTGSFEETVRDCCQILGNVEQERELCVSLSGGARDVLLPLTVATLVYARRVDTTLFFSDLSGDVREWSIPALATNIPDRALDTFTALVEAGDWLTLSELTTMTDSSKSTVIRHVNDLETAAIVQGETSGKAKRVRVTFTGELLSLAQYVQNPQTE
jgi:CRISPR-associated protein Csa3